MTRRQILDHNRHLRRLGLPSIPVPPVHQWYRRHAASVPSRINSEMPGMGKS
jgi:hypothetical protein